MDKEGNDNGSNEDNGDPNNDPNKVCFDSRNKMLVDEENLDGGLFMDEEEDNNLDGEEDKDTQDGVFSMVEDNAAIITEKITEAAAKDDEGIGINVNTTLCNMRACVVFVEEEDNKEEEKGINKKETCVDGKGQDGMNTTNNHGDHLVFKEITETTCVTTEEEKEGSTKVAETKAPTEFGSKFAIWFFHSNTGLVFTAAILMTKTKKKKKEKEHNYDDDKTWMDCHKKERRCLQAKGSTVPL